MKAPECPNCREAMSPGYLLDHSHGYFAQGAWVAGVPEKSFWSGLKMRGKLKYPITSYRCVRCHLLVSYAHPEPPK